MHPVGSRKDHRFDSDGQIKATRGQATRGRGTNENSDLIREQLYDCLACGRYEQQACPDNCPHNSIA